MRRDGAYLGCVQHFDHFIGGRFEPSADGRRMEVEEPASGGVYASLAAGGVADVDRAIAAAHGALEDWGRAGAESRAACLDRLADLVKRDAEALARAESVDSGKPISLARSVEIPRAQTNLRFFAQQVRRWNEQVLTLESGARSRVLRRPLGVAACISPWNLPLYLFTWKIAPALAAGCTVVAKPSEVTPATATMLAALAQEAGFPAGVLNVVHGRGAETGAALVAHPGIAAITFTGGTTTGEQIARDAAPRFRRLSLELGGKNAAIVFADAAEQSLDTLVRASFQNQGQICLCASRLLVERCAFESLTRAFVGRVRALRLGDPLDESTEQGALVSAAHLAKVESAVTRARAEGGKLECGGRRPSELPTRCSGGYFFEPTVFTGLGPDCVTNQEEIFGPVVSIMPFDSEDEAVAIANGTRYGLAASVFCADSGRANRVAARLDVGTVWVNCWLVRDLRAPFGGWKDSGVGREGGDDALRFFAESTTVCELAGAARA